MMTTSRKSSQRWTAFEKIEGGKARVERQRAAAAKAEAPRICAARPSGPYGIDAPKKCTKPRRRANAALCEAHEKMWRVEARRRAAAMDTAKSQHNATTPGEAAAPLAARDLAAFATPELAAKARAKRAARKAANA